MAAGVYVGWNIGANDTANCIGPTVGCGLLTFRKAAILVAIFVVLGGVLQGRHVMETIGKGIIAEELNYTAIMVALICSGFFVTIATFFKIPTSTSEAIVGGVAGIGLAVGSDINYSKLITIAESWIICPFLTMALSYMLSHMMSIVLRRIRISAILVQNALGWLALMSGCYVAYSLGANHAGIAVGPISKLGIFPPNILLFVGSVAIAIGAITYGKKVTDTVKIETQADLIRHEIRNKLYYGAYMPLLREDIYKLVECIDMVANSAEKCCDFFLNQRPVIPDFFKTRIS